MRKKPGRRVLFPAFAAWLLLFAVRCFAGLGETQEQCAARYGAGRETDGLKPAFRFTTWTYRKDDYEIVVHFKDGRAVAITYTLNREFGEGYFTGPFLTAARIRQLLAENAGFNYWKPENPLWADTWIRSDGKAVARVTAGDAMTGRDEVDVFSDNPVEVAVVPGYRPAKTAAPGTGIGNFCGALAYFPNTTYLRRGLDASIHFELGFGGRDYTVTGPFLDAAGKPLDYSFPDPLRTLPGRTGSD